MKTTTSLPALTMPAWDPDAARRFCHRALPRFLAALTFASPPAQAAAIEAWVHRYTGPIHSNVRARTVAVDGSGNVVVTRTTYNGTNADFHTAKYGAANGALLWERSYNGPSNRLDQASGVAVDAHGDVIVTGVSDAEPDVWGLLLGGDDYTAKYAAQDGALLWQRRHNSSSRGYHGGPTLAVDDSGNAVVAGYSERDNYTSKYGAADGALLWERHYSSPGKSEGDAIPMAVDGGGNVVVAGSSTGTGSYDIYTAKYGAADGTLLWEQRDNGPSNAEAEAVAVTADGGGNVVVTGFSRNSSGNLDYYTAKYAAANGAPLWGKRYNGPSNGWDVALAVAVDGGGNVVVTGFSDDPGGSHYTAKYAAADGGLLWEKRAQGGGQAVAADGGGNVIVTGYSADGSYTAKYAAADGGLLWEHGYKGGHAISLALGFNGMVAVTGSSSSESATVVYWEHLPPVSVSPVPTGIRLRSISIPGRSHTIERAPGVAGPWSILSTQAAPASARIEFVDTGVGHGSAFYRAVTP